jgi:ABC-type nickel/cobalt efflux system permease component RcnA
MDTPQRINKPKENSVVRLRSIAAFIAVFLCVFTGSIAAHPLGNFSVNQYSALRIGKGEIELRYIVDMAEIPTFQEIQQNGFVPSAVHASASSYLLSKMEALRDGLALEVKGRKIALRTESCEILFPEGAGGLPTMKIGALFKGKFDASKGFSYDLFYRDGNFPGRAGWKEIIAISVEGELIDSSVPTKDRSAELSDYPTDLLNSPPQQLEARVSFFLGAPTAVVSMEIAGTVAKEVAQRNQPIQGRLTAAKVESTSSENWPAEKMRQTTTNIGSARSNSDSSIQLKANRQARPRDSLTELVATKQLGSGIILISLVVAAGLGAFHALEPGHGKTLVAAYLVGSHGTAKHALLLGLIVTAAHTAGVYLLGAVTLYASQYVVPEQLYPWLGIVSGAMIAVLGVVLFVRRYKGKGEFLTHTHRHHAHAHGADDHHHYHHGHEHHHHQHDRQVSLRELLTLGISGGIVPCPAALVVLLSAVSLHRVEIGLLLIVAFSVGLAAVLIAVGMLMVYTRQFMSRFHGDGTLTTRWLPLASSAFITLCGVALTSQAVLSAGWISLTL